MIIVSACLIGKNCKYNGGNNYNQAVIDYLSDKEYIAFCPEVEAGLPTPRPPVELQENKAINAEGQDVTSSFSKGAQKALLLCLDKNIDTAILKEQSPSCGVNKIYDGSFNGIKIAGKGMTADLLSRHGIILYSEKDIELLK